MEVRLSQPDIKGHFPILFFSPETDIQKLELELLEKILSTMPPSVTIALGCEFCPARKRHPQGPEAYVLRLPNGKRQVGLRCRGAEKYIPTAQVRPELAQAQLACSEESVLYVNTNVSHAVPLESLTWSMFSEPQ